MGILVGKSIANVERIKLETEETTPKVYVFEIATSCKYTPTVSAGTEVEQRIKNTIYGVIQTEDIVKGYDIEFTNERLIPEVLALIDGGALITDTDDEFESYSSPVAGQPVSRKNFTLHLYTSDRSTDGSATEYHDWCFVGCKGKPVDGSVDDGNFSKQAYKLTSRPAAGVSPMTVTRIEQLPSVT